jgi:hypothetical protein
VESHQCKRAYAWIIVTRLIFELARAFSIMPFVWCLG